MRTDYDDILYMHDHRSIIDYFEDSFVFELVCFLGNSVKALFSMLAFLVSTLAKVLCFAGKAVYKFFNKLIINDVKQLVINIKNDSFAKNKKALIKLFVNCLLPVAAVVAVVVTVNCFNDSTYALEITYNGKNIGCIADESVLESAENMARERLLNGLNTVNDHTDDVIGTPQYKLIRTSKNKLTDAATLCDRMIEYSDYDVADACGIYLDGKFLCAVKNETDAREVFASVLDRRKKENITVDYIKKIDYKQGLYPDNGDVIRDTKALTKEAESLGVKALRTKKIYKSIPYSTVTQNSSRLYYGDTKTVAQGKNGVMLVTSEETYIGGKLVSRAVVNEKVVKAPVTEKVIVGTGTKQGITVSADDGQYWNVGGGVFAWPVPSIHHITSYFGSRWGRTHTGIDISGGGAYGSNIVAAAYGVVESVESDYWGYGCCVIINHGNGIKTRYAHCIDGSIIVTPGQVVSRGQKIALVGNTGNSTGPHLHFEIIINGEPINPLLYL